MYGLENWFLRCQHSQAISGVTILAIPATEHSNIQSIVVAFSFSWQGFTEHGGTVYVFQVYRQSLASFVNVNFTKKLQTSIRRQIGLTSWWCLGKYHLWAKCGIGAVRPERTGI
jgi:hypothetical protein